MADEFELQLNQLISRITTTRDDIKTEEATKMAFIIPFFQNLGYDVYNPKEFVPEFIADIGIKKGEKVDYAIMNDANPTILIEAKWCGDSLSNHDDQLFRYFTATNAKFAILSNGIIYKFFTDLDEPNKMDKTPFLEINLLDIKESQLLELKKFKKNKFNLDDIFSTASELKYLNNIKILLSKQLKSPSDDFVKFILSNMYDGVKTQNAIDKFKPIVKKSFNQFTNELVNERLKSALSSDDIKVLDININNNSVDKENFSNANEYEESKPISKIVTTEEELECFYIIKAILAETVDIEKISYKDTETYFGILYDNNIRKWVCRLKLSKSRKLLITSDESKNELKFNFEKSSELFNFREEIITSLRKYL